MTDTIWALDQRCARCAGVRLCAVANETDVQKVYISVFEDDRCAATRVHSVGNAVTTWTDAGGSSFEVPSGSPARRMMSHGWQQDILQRSGVAIEGYLPELRMFYGRATRAQIEQVRSYDFVNFIESHLNPRPMHDESSPLILADRPRLDYAGGTGSVAIVGIIDSGVESSHSMLNHTFGLGWSFITGASAWDDGCGHGSHVAGTMFGEPTSANSGLRGIAPGAGFAATARIRNRDVRCLSISFATSRRRALQC